MPTDEPTPVPVPDGPADPLDLARQLDAMAAYWSRNARPVADILDAAAAHLRRIPGLEDNVQQARQANLHAVRYAMGDLRRIPALEDEVARLRAHPDIPVPVLVLSMGDGEVHGFGDADDARRFLDEHPNWSHGVWVREWVWHPGGAGTGGNTAERERS